MPLPSTARPAVPQPGQPVEASWGEAVAESVIQRFADTNERNTDWTNPPDGAVAYTRTDNTLWLRINGTWAPIVTGGAPRAGNVILRAEGALQFGVTDAGQTTHADLALRNLIAHGSVDAASVNARGGLTVGGDGTANRFLANYLHSYGNIYGVGLLDVAEVQSRSGRFHGANPMRFIVGGVEAGQFQLVNHYGTPNTMFRIGATDGRPAVWMAMTSQFGLMFWGTDPGNYDWIDGGTYVVLNAGGFTNRSDARLKSDIEDAPTGMLERVCRVKPKRYKVKHAGKVEPVEEVGLVAQDLVGPMPDTVRNMGDHLGYSLDSLLAHLVGAVGELNAKVEAQAAEIGALRSEIETLKGAAAS